MRRKPIIFLFLLFIVTNSVFAQIQSGQMFLRFAGNATRRIGKKDDLSNVKALGQVAFGYYFSPKLAVGIEAGYGFNTIRDMNETGWFNIFLRTTASICAPILYPLRSIYATISAAKNLLFRISWAVWGTIIGK